MTTNFSIEKTKPKEFKLYRYQLYVQEPFQPELQGVHPGNNIETPIQLKEERNAIMREALGLIPQVATLTNHGYKIILTAGEGSQYLLMADSQRSKKITTRDHIDKKVDHHPWAWIAIDTADDVQTIAIAPESDMRVETVMNKLTSNLQRLLKKRGLTFIAHPIISETAFWKFVRENEGKLREVTFTVSPPNMAGLSRTVGQQLTEIIKTTKARKAEVSLKASRGEDLKLLQSDARLKNFVDYVGHGGGGCTFKRKGSSKIIDLKNEQESIMATPAPHVQLVEIEATSPGASILTKIRIKYRIPEE